MPALVILAVRAKLAVFSLVVKLVAALPPTLAAAPIRLTAAVLANAPAVVPALALAALALPALPLAVNALLPKSLLM